MAALNKKSVDDINVKGQESSCADVISTCRLTGRKDHR